MPYNDIHPFKHCHYCGAELSGALETPDGPQCRSCNNTTWMNVPSVAGLIIPVDPKICSGRKHGIWAMRRGENPFQGELALPAGFRMFNKRPLLSKPVEETWQKTGTRETDEEINVVCDPDYVEHILTESAHDPNNTGNRDLIIGQANHTIHVGLFEPSSETLERTILFPGEEELMCFSVHRKAVRMYWNKYLDLESVQR